MFTVSELIEELEKLEDKEAQVLVYSFDDSMPAGAIEINDGYIVIY